MANQLLSLLVPDLLELRHGFPVESAIFYDVSDGNASLTGASPSLYFDSSQLSIEIDGEPYQFSLLGERLTPDDGDGDGNPQTDYVLALTYTDFGGRFPGSNVDLPLNLADIIITPTADFEGSSIVLTSNQSPSGYDVVGDTLVFGYNAAPEASDPDSIIVVDALSDWSYRLPEDFFVDVDSALDISIDSSLPEWLSYDEESKEFSGSPSSSADSSSINLSASDELGSISTSLSFAVRDVQQISAGAMPLRYRADTTLSFPLIYSSTDQADSTGLSFDLFYDSSIFEFVDIDDQIEEIFGFAVSDDLANADADPSTDSVLSVSLVSFEGSLASGTTIGSLEFQVANLPLADPSEVDPVTGLRPSQMNLLASNTATDYGFHADPITLEPAAFDLDVDGDGSVTALGDGLMIIRKLFGPAFSGDALTDKAIGDNAERTTQEIHDFIQLGVDSLSLDVDQDGSVTALGDGLMIIRHLFGPAFSGSALTDKALGADSPFASDPEPWVSVAGNIDALRPSN